MSYAFELVATVVRRKRLGKHQLKAGRAVTNQTCLGIQGEDHRLYSLNCSISKHEVCSIRHIIVYIIPLTLHTTISSIV